MSLAKTRSKPRPQPEYISQLLYRLGGVPPSRVRLRPAPGTATEKDVLAIRDHEDRLCELVDGVLVEKAMGFQEALLAMAIGTYLRTFVKPRRLGIVGGPDIMLRLRLGLIRIPDVAFISWNRLPDRRIPDEPVPAIAPDLAVEVLSKSNTRREMALKRTEYFAAGCRLVWQVDPKRRTVEVFTDPKTSILVEEADTLAGKPVLPGFRLALAELFAELDERGPTPAK